MAAFHAGRVLLRGERFIRFSVEIQTSQGNTIGKIKLGNIDSDLFAFFSDMFHVNRKAFKLKSHTSY